MRFASVRLALVLVGFLSLAGCADFAQDLYDSWASDNCSKGTTADQQQACQDSVDRNSRDHRE
jgi:hypothetical protein